MKIRDFFLFDYESKIRFSLVVFILLLILLNFGTEYLFHQTKQVLKNQTDQLLASVAFSAGSLWDKCPPAILQRNLLELSFKSDINRISFLSSDGAPLISSREIISPEELHTFRGLKPDLIIQIKGPEEKQNIETIFSDFYSDRGGNTYLTCYMPLEISANSKSPARENMIWVMVEKDVSALANIQQMSKLNAWIRMGALIIIAIVTLILIKNLLKPYRLMMKRAESENIVPLGEGRGKEGELDAAVNIFEQVIRELKQKEETLQKLYLKTDRKAKDLASYNEYILKSMTSGMIICNDQGEIIQINQPAEVILGLSRNFVTGKRYKIVFRNQSPVCSAIQTTLTEQKTCSVPEMEMTARNGETVWLSINSTLIKDEQGRMLGVVVFLNDLTEIKKLEQEIAFKDKLAALGEMSSGLAHELRNSMGAILGFAKLLLKRKDDPVLQNQTIDRIVNEAMGMETMLKRFLDFAKPFHIKPEQISLKEILEEGYLSVKETLKEAQIMFKFDSKPDLPSIRGDRLLLKQCFQNLIQNSIEAMPRGGKLNIRLGELPITPHEESILVEISDTGYGIPREIQKKIFNPFFTSKEKGTGLGLSLVKKIVNLHQGNIELESEPNQGTTFRIYLPIKPSIQTPPEIMEEKVDLKPQLQSL